MTPKSNLYRSFQWAQHVYEKGITAYHPKFSASRYRTCLLTSILASTLVFLTTASSTLADQGLLFAAIAGEKKIITFSQASDTGRLDRIAEIGIEAEPGYLVANKHGTRLFAAYRSSGELASYQIDSNTGQLTLISNVSGGADPAYVALDRTESYLMSAYYRAGKVGLHPFGPTGEIKEAQAQWYPTNLKAHAILTDPTNQWALVPHTGPNAIYIFSLDSDTGQLIPSTPPLTYTGKHTGPRHLQFHPSLDIVYVDNEQGSSVGVFNFDSQVGQINHLQTHSTLPIGHRGPNSCADLEITSDGHFLYASNRGHKSIAAYKIDPETGKLNSLGQFDTEAVPRSFTISPSGKWLVVAGQETGYLQSYSINRATGYLTPQQRIQAGSRPWAVLSIAPGIQ